MKTLSLSFYFKESSLIYVIFAYNAVKNSQAWNITVFVVYNNSVSRHSTPRQLALFITVPMYITQLATKRYTSNNMKDRNTLRNVVLSTAPSLYSTVIVCTSSSCSLILSTISKNSSFNSILIQPIFLLAYASYVKSEELT